MSIKDFISWCKDNLKWLIFSSSLILIIFLSFSTGYLVAKQEPTPIVIEKCSDLE